MYGAARRSSSPSSLFRELFGGKTWQPPSQRCGATIPFKSYMHSGDAARKPPISSSSATQRCVEIFSSKITQIRSRIFIVQSIRQLRAVIGRFASRFIRNQARSRFAIPFALPSIPCSEGNNIRLQTSPGRKSSFAIAEINSVSTIRIPRIHPPDSPAVSMYVHPTDF